MHPKITHLSNPAKRLQGEAIFAVLGLIILSFAAYLNALSNTFVFDYVYVISENYFIRDWQNIYWLFTSKYFAVSGELSYRPVVTLSYFVDYSRWLLNPPGYHLTNIILLVLNIVPITNIMDEHSLYIPLVGFCIMGSISIMQTNTRYLRPAIFSDKCLSRSFLRDLE